MDMKEMEQKISNVKSGKSMREIFIKPRPPEEFGDAVELSYNEGLKSYVAIVFDPDMKTIYSEEAFQDESELKSFIQMTLK